MAEEKPGIEQLSQDDLKSVKAGLPPYESPEIVDLSALLATLCKTGSYCNTGGNNLCANGIDCRSGKLPE